MSERLVAVAVPVPLYGSFDYRLPQGLEAPAGSRVRVPFGKRRLTGVVLRAVVPAVAEAGAAPEYRDVESLLDASPLLSETQLALAGWIADYYRHPIGEVIAALLPVALRGEAPAVLRRPLCYRLTEAGRAALASLPVRSQRQRELLQRLAAAPSDRAGLDDLPGVAAQLRRALAEGWVDSGDDPAPPPWPSPPQAEALLPLTEDQARAVAALDAALAQPEARCHLLQGVTGSGKTEVYLRAMAEVIASGRQALLLVPEIGLTPQLLDRVRQRFGSQAVAAYHSGLADPARAQVWLAARAGELAVVVGTRSAVLLPLPKLRLVIVDEEHDASFKQQDGLRYSARDLAVLRGLRERAHVILGSATPSLETLRQAQSGRYAWLRLPQRVHSLAPPKLQLLDVRKLPMRDGLSPMLEAAVGRHLDAGGQVLLFVNRRGYAPTLLCHDCGWTAACRNCDARLTWHRSRHRLICHHCGARQSPPRECPQCKSQQFVAVGQGTERVEDVLRARFPQARVERFDSDRLRSPRVLDALLQDTREGRVNVLVGTQMLAKGHDFAGLSLVGVIDTDQALFSVDFRALERMGQLLTQVAGRAGRAGRAGQRGEVLLQTHQPTHPALRCLVEEGYEGLSTLLMAEREAAVLPPYAHLALLRAEARSEAAAMDFLQAAAELLPRESGVAVLGPVPAPMERRAGRYRAQLLLQSVDRMALQRALKPWVLLLDGLPGARGLRWSLDVDPVDLY